MKTNKFLKFILLLLCIITPLLLTSKVSAQESNVVYVYEFYKEGCSHCKAFEEFMKKNYSGNKNVVLTRYEYVKTTKLFDKFAEAYNISDKSSRPCVFIGGKYFIGFSNTIKAQMKYFINKYMNNDYINAGAMIINGQELPDNFIDNEVIAYDLPFLGEVTATDVSLLLLSVTLGFSDGLNPCGMWVLLFIITLLIQTKNRKKMWLFGGAFILLSGIFYFIMMLFTLEISVALLSVNNIFMKIIGIVALLVGAYNIYKFIKVLVKKEEGCEVTSNDTKRKLSKKIKNTITSGNVLIALGGIAVVTLVVNLFEYGCSLGYPVIFTSILAMNNISRFSQIIYILIYVLFFLIDDLFVFAIAVFSMKLTAVSNKLSKYGSLIGGIIMLIFGILIVFFPDLLTSLFAI